MISIKDTVLIDGKTETVKVLSRDFMNKKTIVIFESGKEITESEYAKYKQLEIEAKDDQPDQPDVEDEDQKEELANLKAEYLELTGKEVPKNKAKDQTWIAEKIQELKQ